MKLGKLLRNGVAGIMIAAVPVSTSFAATRPNAAVPAAGSSAVTAQDYDDNRVAWLPIAIIIGTILLAIYLLTKGDGDDDGNFSQG